MRWEESSSHGPFFALDLIVFDLEYKFGFASWWKWMKHTFAINVGKILRKLRFLFNSNDFTSAVNHWTIHHNCKVKFEKMSLFGLWRREMVREFDTFFTQKKVSRPLHPITPYTFWWFNHWHRLHNNCFTVKSRGDVERVEKEILHMILIKFAMSKVFNSEIVFRRQNFELASKLMIRSPNLNDLSKLNY